MIFILKSVRRVTFDLRQLYSYTEVWVGGSDPEICSHLVSVLKVRDGEGGVVKVNDTGVDTLNPIQRRREIRGLGGNRTSDMDLIPLRRVLSGSESPNDTVRVAPSGDSVLLGVSPPAPIPPSKVSLGARTSRKFLVCGPGRVLEIGVSRSYRILCVRVLFILYREFMFKKCQILLPKYIDPN